MPSAALSRRASRACQHSRNQCAAKRARAGSAQPRAEDAQGTPTQSHSSPRIVYGDKHTPLAGSRDRPAPHYRVLSPREQLLRSCTCEAQDPEQSRTGWDAQCKSDSVLAKHGTRAVQRERVLSESEHDCQHETLVPVTTAEMCSDSEAGSYLRLINSCVTQLEAQEPCRTCDES